MSVALLLAQPENEQFPLNDETVSPGYLGFAVFLALCVAVYLLLRSMNKQINKIQVPREADLEEQERERAAAESGDEGDEADKASGEKSGKNKARGPAKAKNAGGAGKPKRS